jgi:hypothetical protein
MSNYAERLMMTAEETRAYYAEIADAQHLSERQRRNQGMQARSGPLR